MSTALETNEKEFVRELRRALDESAASLPAPARDRLAAARHAALARKKAEPQFVRVAAPSFAAAGMPGGIGMAPDLPRRRRARLARFALAWPLAALVAGLFAIAYVEDQQRTAELADIDAAMLSDDLPLTAYLDHGFNAYLSRAH
ncbi:DUF3619 family protein [Paraburkholderia caballeronis]|uniref:DUF3619 family protein n=1 Tax=Paraburkholderia caballeronis TaxID=416943 RepID=A0A1H7T8S3_9BURK|nr:DUF3619 family protein [Paraburkholderia caballeronis]PXW22666.1 uncharacterized protein DUF3619 [Paraburkholderia caballeronis]PXW96769.1 uncharacterized protein DUF3619 [Paraburkholderia caballeronis]RAJ93396.1 uncharacterized protein DUF3619 [Paraburkholderia caballeronis]TDV12121.1 uncharacterized protein DUF3619 [Paraburkholderia caballeronis]TDV15196.1 uncharacterized protein DUF3619 [Paraburkholderia caballeronis]